MDKTLSKRKRYYLALPITSRSEITLARKFDAARRRAEELKRYIVRNIDSNADVVTPFSFSSVHTDEHRAIGLCVEYLLGCDAIVLACDWEKSRGCTLEKNVAEIYNKGIIFLDV